ncbi:hypothetical protein BH11CYA1_BH11CYA1_49530 [soil metagenome]
MQRLNKARRAYQKAKQSVTLDDYEEAIEHSRRGLLHVELAKRHFNSSKTDLSQLTAPAPNFSEGSCEESIQTLVEAITQIKLVVEYKKITLNRRLKERLLEVVQTLQDAIESYGQADSDKEATKLAECGLVWAQFVYGHLTNDELYSKKHPNKAIRSLNSFAWQITTTFSRLTLSSGLSQINQVRSQMHSLEKGLQSALDAYMKGDSNNLEKFLRLGQIESQALSKYEAHAQSSAQTKKESELSANFNLSASESTSLKEDLARMASLLKKHYPTATKAQQAVEELGETLPKMKRALKEQNWQQAAILLDLCESNADILKSEIAKLDI